MRRSCKWPIPQVSSTEQVPAQRGYGVVLDRGAQYTDGMRIPHTQLSPVALRAVVEEFVTRDGTDHSPVERRIETVLRQLDTGRVELHFDGETETCQIVPVEGTPPADSWAK